MTEEQETKRPENSINTEGISIGNSPYPPHDIKKGNDSKKEDIRLKEIQLLLNELKLKIEELEKLMGVDKSTK